MKKIILSIVAITTLVTTKAQNCTTCGLPGWTYTTSLEVSNTTADTLNNYALSVTINTQALVNLGLMEASGDDIRFTTDCNTVVGHWIEDSMNTTTTKVWIEMAQMLPNSTDTIYMHHGNPSAANAEAPHQVFTFFDHFDSLNTNIWNVTAINATTSNSILTLNTPSSSAGISTNQFFVNSGNINYAATWYTKMNNNSPNKFVNLGFGYDINPWNSRTGIYGYVDNGNDRFGAQNSYTGGDCAPNISTTNLSYHKHTTILNTRFEFDETPQVWCGTLIDSMRAAVSTWSSGADVDIDWLYVRPSIDPEPSVIELTTDTLILVDLTSVDLVCFGDTNGQGIATPVTTNSPYSYAWDANTNNQTDSVATALSGGTYLITVTDNGGCTLVDSITVLEPNDISVSISTTGNTVGCNGDATANPTGGTPPYTYLWDANANNQTNQTATGLCEGNYSVTVTDSLGCEKVETTTVVGITESKQLNAFSIYPNPTNQFITITYNGNESLIEIHNAIGKLVNSIEIKKNSTSLDLSSFTKGVYFVKIGSQTKKLLVQ